MGLADSRGIGKCPGAEYVDSHGLSPQLVLGTSELTQN